jgi:hypothetical protein
VNEQETKITGALIPDRAKDLRYLDRVRTSGSSVRTGRDASCDGSHKEENPDLLAFLDLIAEIIVGQRLKRGEIPSE